MLFSLLWVVHIWPLYVHLTYWTVQLNQVRIRGTAPTGMCSHWSSCLFLCLSLSGGWICPEDPAGGCAPLLGSRRVMRGAQSAASPHLPHCSVSWGCGLRVHKWMMVQLPSLPGSGEGEGRCMNHSLAKSHTHGGHWAELSVGVFISQVKKLLKRRDIRTRSILGDAQRHTLHACLTVFIAFIGVQGRSFTEGVFCLSITGVLGSTCRFQTIVTCPLLCLTGN